MLFKKRVYYLTLSLYIFTLFFISTGIITMSISTKDTAINMAKIKSEIKKNEYNNKLVSSIKGIIESLENFCNDLGLESEEEIADLDLTQYSLETSRNINIYKISDFEEIIKNNASFYTVKDKNRLLTEKKACISINRKTEEWYPITIDVPVLFNGNIIGVLRSQMNMTDYQKSIGEDIKDFVVVNRYFYEAMQYTPLKIDYRLENRMQNKTISDLKRDLNEFGSGNFLYENNNSLFLASYYTIANDDLGIKNWHIIYFEKVEINPIIVYFLICLLVLVSIMFIVFLVFYFRKKDIYHHLMCHLVKTTCGGFYFIDKNLKIKEAYEASWFSSGFVKNDIDCFKNVILQSDWIDFEALKRIFIANDFAEVKVRIKTNNNEYRWVKMRLLCTNKKKPYATLSIHDVTEYLDVINGMKHSDDALGGIIKIDIENNHINYVSEEISLSLGYSVSDLLNAYQDEAHSLFLESDYKKIVEFYEQGSFKEEIRLYGKGGNVIWFTMSGEWINGILVAKLIDITALRKFNFSMEKESHINEIYGEYYVSLDTMYFSDDFCKIFKVANKYENISKIFENLLKYIHHDDAPIVTEIFNNAQTSISPFYFITRILIDGEYCLWRITGAYDIDDKSNSYKIVFSLNPVEDK